MFFMKALYKLISIKFCDEEHILRDNSKDFNIVISISKVLIYTIVNIKFKLICLITFFYSRYPKKA